MTTCPHSGCWHNFFIFVLPACLKLFFSSLLFCWFYHILNHLRTNISSWETSLNNDADMKEWFRGLWLRPEFSPANAPSPELCITVSHFLCGVRFFFWPLRRVPDTDLSQLNNFLHVGSSSCAAYPQWRHRALLWLLQWRHFPETDTRKPLEVFPRHCTRWWCNGNCCDMARQKVFWRWTQNSGFG